MESTSTSKLPFLEPGPAGDEAEKNDDRGRPTKSRPPSQFCPGIQVLGISKKFGLSETEKFFEKHGNQLGRLGLKTSATSRTEWDSSSGKRVEVIRSQSCLEVTRDVEEVTSLPVRQTLPDCEGLSCDSCQNWSRFYFRTHNKSSGDPSDVSQSIEVGERQERRRTQDQQNKIESEINEFLDKFTLNFIVRSLISCLLLNSMRSLNHKIYPQAIIWLATILISYSSAGYRFLRESITLPSPSTIRPHIDTSDLGCGFTPTGMLRIKNMLGSCEGFFGIQMDECSIKPNLKNILLFGFYE